MMINCRPDTYLFRCVGYLYQKMLLLEWQQADFESFEIESIKFWEDFEKYERSMWGSIFDDYHSRLWGESGL